MLTGHATVLLVENVRRATEYYRDRLGFDVELYDKIPDHHGYASRDGCYLHFARFDSVTARPNSEVVPRDMFDAYFWVEDVDALYSELSARGATIVHGPGGCGLQGDHGDGGAGSLNDRGVPPAARDRVGRGVRRGVGVVRGGRPGVGRGGRDRWDEAPGERLARAEPVL
jgi:catechol 2,3-dioxygenase-like lactoylglutathione lyase family enzyme